MRVHRHPFVKSIINNAHDSRRAHSNSRGGFYSRYLESVEQARYGHVTFTWLVAFLSAIFYTPVSLGVIFVTQQEIGIAEIVLMAGSAVLHSAYFILLNQGYRVGDLSLVYPLARGTGPLLSSRRGYIAAR